MSLSGVQSRIILSISNRENLIQEFGYRSVGRTKGTRERGKGVGRETIIRTHTQKKTMVGNYAGQYGSLGLRRNIPYITLQMFG